MDEEIVKVLQAFTLALDQLLTEETDVEETKIGKNITVYHPERDYRNMVSDVLKYLRFMEELTPTPRELQIVFPLLQGIESGATSETLDSISISTIPFAIDTLTKSLGKKALIRDYHMPTEKKVPNPLYVVAHEWGHVHQPKPYMSREDGINLLTSRFMSRYGRDSGEEDRYAEAFAEWHLSLGKTRNEAACEYAKKYEWRTDFSEIKLPI